MFGFDKRAAKYTFTAAVVLLLMYALFMIRSTIFVLIVSLLLAYLLYPVVGFVNRYMPKDSQGLSLALVYMLLIGSVVAVIVTVGSEAADEAASLSQRAPEFIQRMKQTPSPSTPAQVQSLKESALSAAQNYVYKHSSEMASFLPTISLEILKASKNLIYLVIVPILSFFILKDGTRMRDELLDMIEPGRMRELVDKMLEDSHALLLQYMRALFILCSITFVTFSIVLGFMGVPYALLLASVAFPLEFIPLIGPLVAAAAILSVTIFSGYSNWLGVLIFLAAYRMIQDYVISPRLMSAGVELHPLLVIVGVFAGGEIGGIEGTFLSVPVLALLRVIYRRIQSSRQLSLHPILTQV